MIWVRHSMPYLAGFFCLSFLALLWLFGIRGRTYTKADPLSLRARGLSAGQHWYHNAETASRRAVWLDRDLAHSGAGLYDYDFNAEDVAFGPSHGPHFVESDLLKLPKGGILLTSAGEDLAGENRSENLLDLDKILKQPPKSPPRPYRTKDAKGFARWAAEVAANYNVRSDYGKGLFEQLTGDLSSRPNALVDDPNNREVEVLPNGTTVLALQGFDELDVKLIDGEEYVGVYHAIKDVDIDAVQPTPPHLNKLREDLPAYQMINETRDTTYDNRWLTYHPHGSIAAQIIQMYNALTMSYALDRQLLLPGLILSDAPDFAVWDELEAALADRCFLPPLPDVDTRAEWARALPDVVPFSHLFDFEHYSQETGVKVVELPSCDTMHAYEAVGITFEQAVAVRDRELYYRRITDREAQPLWAVKTAPHYHLATPLDLLREIPDALLIFHTLYGPDRLDLSPVQNPHLVAAHRLAQLSVRMTEGPVVAIVEKVVKRLQSQGRAYVTLDLAQISEPSPAGKHEQHHLGSNGQFLRSSSSRVAVAPYIQALRQHPLTRNHVNSFSGKSSARVREVVQDDLPDVDWEVVTPHSNGDGPSLDEINAQLQPSLEDVLPGESEDGPAVEGNQLSAPAFGEVPEAHDDTSLPDHVASPTVPSEPFPGQNAHLLSPPNLFVSTTVDDPHTALFGLFAEYPSTYIYGDLDSSERIPTEIRKRLKTRSIPYGGVNGGGLTACLSALREFEEYIITDVVDVAAAQEAGVPLPADTAERKAGLMKPGLYPTKRVSYRQRITKGRSLIPLVEMEVAARAAAIVNRKVVDHLGEQDAPSSDPDPSQDNTLRPWTSRTAVIQMWWEAEHPPRDVFSPGTSANESAV